MISPSPTSGSDGKAAFSTLRHAGRPVYDTEIADVTYHDAADRLTVDASGQVQVVAELRSKRVRMSLLTDDPAASALCAHPLLTLCLLELMKRHGRYPLHAGGVAVGADAVLLPGASGAGKSTLTAALLQLGTGFLSDDIVFLTPDERGVEVFSFADQLDVTDSTAAMFPELSDLLGVPLPPGRPKHQVRAETCFGSARVDRAPPAAIVLPAISRDPGSTLREADPGDLLAHLAPNILLTDAASSQRHLDTLAALVDSVPAYHLVVGSDLSGAARLVLSLLA